jgi:hypothetical protein
MQVATPGFPEIFSAASPEEYEYRSEWLAPGDTAEQLSDEEVVFKDSEGDAIGWIHPELAHDAVGTNVPTSMRLVEAGAVILTVHHREGNPAADWAPFDYPVIDGPGGFRTIIVEMRNPLGEADQKVIEANPPAPTEPLPTPTCKVPALRGYSLRGAKNRLRAAHCGIGVVHLAVGATAGKGKVVKQFHAAGTELAAGAPVAVKLGVGR